MAKLIYTSITSLDGFIEDRDGKFDWAEPNEEVHTFVNDLERPIGTYLYGRKMYEVMTYWESPGSDVNGSPYLSDYAQLWQAADKIVYSKTLEAVSTARTRIESDFDPGAVRAMKASAGRDLSVSGPRLASHALRAGLVDELGVIVYPVVMGGGKHYLPPDLTMQLELREERRLAGGVVYLNYEVAGQPQRASG